MSWEEQMGVNQIELKKTDAEVIALLQKQLTEANMKIQRLENTVKMFQMTQDKQREFFASSAMNAIVAREGYPIEQMLPLFAERSVRLADALMARLRGNG